MDQEKVLCIITCSIVVFNLYGFEAISECSVVIICQLLFLLKSILIFSFQTSLAIAVLFLLFFISPWCFFILSLIFCLVTPIYNLFHYFHLCIQFYILPLSSGLIKSLLDFTYWKMLELSLIGTFILNFAASFLIIFASPLQYGIVVVFFCMKVSKNLFCSCCLYIQMSIQMKFGAV